METLTNLEIEMERIINQVRNGIRTLQHTDPPLQQEPIEPFNRLDES